MVNIDQWNKGVQKCDIYSHIYDQLIFCNRAKVIQWRNDSLFNK